MDTFFGKNALKDGILPSLNFNTKTIDKMKTLLTAFLFFSTLISSIGQTNLYALRYDALNHTYDLIEINSLTGVQQTVAPAIGFEPMIGISKPIVNPYNNTYNILTEMITGMDSLQYVNNRYIFSFDLNTGSIDTIQVDSLIRTLDYSCTENAFYYLSYDYNTGECELHRLDGATWANVTIGQVALHPIWSGTDYPQQTAYDPFKKHLYVHGYPTHVPTGTAHIYTVDVTTGNVIDDDYLTNPNAFHQLAFNITDSTLWGIEVDFTPNERSIVEVEPGSWTTTSVSSNVYDCWYFNFEPAVISENGDEYLFMGLDDVPNIAHRVNSFNLNTGNRSFSPIILDQNIGQIAVKSNYCSLLSAEAIPYEECEINLIFNSQTNSLSLMGDVSPKTAVQIYDIGGRILFQSTTNQAGALQVPDLSEGVYLVSVKGENCHFGEKIFVGR